MNKVILAAVGLHKEVIIMVITWVTNQIQLVMNIEFYLNSK